MKKIICLLSIMLIPVFSVIGLSACIEEEVPSSGEKEFSVLFIAGEGFVLNGEDKVKENSDYIFSLAINDGYKKGVDFAVVVKKDGTPVGCEQSDGEYTVKEVTGNLEISVSGVEKQVLAIEKLLCEGVEFEGEDDVIWGNDYTFSLAIKDGYKQGEDFAVVVKKDGTPVGCEQSDGEYTVREVTGNLEISVSGVEKQVLTIEKLLCDGIEFGGEDNVIWGSDYTFSLAIKDGYKKGEDFAVLVDGEPLQSESENEYVIHDVRFDKSIVVDGVEIIAYNITLVCNEFDDAVENKVIGFKYTDSSISFSVDLSARYSESSVKLSFDGNELVAENGIYTIDNPKRDIEIIVAGVEINSVVCEFRYDGVAKHTISVHQGEKITEEQFAEAENAVMSDLEGKSFIGWRENPMPLNDDAVYNAVVANGEAVNISDKIFSNSATDPTQAAPDKFNSVYHDKAIFAQNKKSPSAEFTVWADIENTDIASYKELYFKIKVDKSWLLLDGWDFYLISGENYTLSDWYFVSAVKTGAKQWIINIEGAKKSSDDYILYRNSALLNKLLTFEMDTRDNEDCKPTEVYITNLLGVKDENVNEKTNLWGTSVSNSAYKITGSPENKNFIPSAQPVPDGYAAVYEYCEQTTQFIHGQNLDETSLENYKIICFALKSNCLYRVDTDNGGVENLPADVWLEHIFVRQEDNSWNLTIYGDEQKIFAYNGLKGENIRTMVWGNLPAGFTHINYDNEKEMLNVYCTEVRGIYNDGYNPCFGELIEKCAFTGTQASDAELPAGYTKVSFRNAFRGDGSDPDDPHGPNTYSRMDISAYKEVRFMTKYTTQYYLWDGWNACWKDEGWVEWKLVNGGENTWTFTATGQGNNTYTADVTGSSLMELLNNFGSGDNGEVLVTELRGIKN